MKRSAVSCLLNLAEAIDRAAAETTTDDVTLEGLKASVDGDVDIDKDAWTSKLNEALGDLGETQEVTADHVKIKVDQGDCLWEIGNALGIDWQTIAEQNGIESPYVIHPDQELTISMDTLTQKLTETRLRLLSSRLCQLWMQKEQKCL